jgi:xylan 1,4-beta-xylosidase
MTAPDKDKTASNSKPTDVQFSAGSGAPSRRLDHHWELAVGGPHAAFALRSDFQEQLRRCRHELGVERLRCHHWFGREVGTVVRHRNELRYSFVSADRINDFLLEMGMQPLVELSFMPEALASGPQTVFHYQANVSPPKNTVEWTELIGRFATHFRDRYGSQTTGGWLFEVWNEPNLTAFWPATMEKYFELYRSTAEALKRVHPNLRVGGPVSAKSQWIDEFMAFCKQGAPVDFVSTHQYPTDALGSESTSTLEQLAKAPRTIMCDQARAAREGIGALPLYYTEWSVTSNPRDPLHDQAYAAAYAVRTALEWVGIVDGSSWWTFTDIFAENYFPAAPFHGGFGLLNIDGVAKPVYRAFQLLHELGEELLRVEGDHPTVSCWVARRGARVDVVLVNLSPPFSELHAETVSVRLDNLGQPSRARLRRIDDEHANPLRMWQELGKPEYPNARELACMHDASAVRDEALSVLVTGEVAEFRISLPPNAVALATFEMDATPSLKVSDGSSDEVLLHELQRELYSYFTRYTDEQSGLTADSSKSPEAMSIAATGLGLVCLPIAVERGWLSRAHALRLATAAGRTFRYGEQSSALAACGYHGFFYHFLDSHGRRARDCELSTIDTALLIAGLLASAAYFDGDDLAERAHREDVVAIEARVEWDWAVDDKTFALRHGWHPINGFLPYNWSGYSEALLLYVLALGSSTHAIPEASYRAFTGTYDWGEVEGERMLRAGPLFIHQLSHCFIDFRGIADAPMRAAASDYFENSRRATLAQSRYAARNPRGFEGYAEDCWGFTACEGPGPDKREIDGKEREFLGYAARGVPDGPDDGTIAPWATLASIAFAPELVLKTTRHFEASLKKTAHGFPTTFNPTFKGKGGEDEGWANPSHFGLNQGPAVAMIENHRTGLPWRLMRGVAVIRRGLVRAGFIGAWLDRP